MAIDTENKRRSTLGLGSGPRILPRPDSVVGAEDRLHFWIYAGIAVGAGLVLIRVTPIIGEFVISHPIQGEFQISHVIDGEFVTSHGTQGEI